MTIARNRRFRMKLSAPIYRLKHRAKIISRDEGIPLHAALDRIAIEEGFGGWSLLAARYAATAPSKELFARLNPGDLVLLGARPGHGKTLMSLEVAVEAMKSGHRGAFFTLEYNETDILNAFRAIGEEPGAFEDRFRFDNSNTISAEYVTRHLETAPRGTLVVIDYLQLLDQKRENPELMSQVRALKTFASDRGLIIVFISQIDRSYDSSANSCPGLEDVRLPNPLDLTLFTKTCFLNDGEVQIAAVS